MPILKLEARRSALHTLHFRFSICDGHHLDFKEVVTSRLSKRRAENSRFLAKETFLFPPKPNSLSRSPIRLFSQYEPIGSESSPFIVDPDMLIDFAEWAFGPIGLPQLRVLAIGDFSHNSRYDGQQILMVRRNCSQKDAEKDFEQFEKSSGCPNWSETFEIATVTDEDTWMIIEKSDWEFLSSCPSHSLLDSPFG